MKTIQMTLDEELIKEVDSLVKKLNTSRSAFTRAALRQAIRDKNDLLLEEKHRKGYKKCPMSKEEQIWKDEQEWGDW